MEKERLPVAEASSPFACPRAWFCERLRDAPFMDHTDPLFQHGRAYDGPEKAPEVLWSCDARPRQDHEAPQEWLRATEFRDEAEVAARKIRQLAALLQASRKTVVYTGAGISASELDQYARSGEKKTSKTKSGKKPDARAAKPTFTHYALSLLGQQGFIHSWLQQNHDGLPQKAGFPQEQINEIHGSWYDPSNVVVKFDGVLRDREAAWMQDDFESADLVLVLGTSLSGMNADQLVTKCARRSLLRELEVIPEVAEAYSRLAPGALVRTVIQDVEYSGVVEEAVDDVLAVRFWDLDDATKILPRGHPVVKIAGDVQVPICAGARVRVEEAFWSDSESAEELVEGWYGTVVRVDEDGDAMVSFPGLDNEWILGVNFDKLRVVLHKQKSSLGSVCLNLQQTPHDGAMTLRLFGKSDDLLKMLIQELGLPEPSCCPARLPQDRRVLVPYDANGHRLQDGKAPHMWVDLRDGQRVRLTESHNMQGARQKSYMHIEEGLGQVMCRDERRASFVLEIEGATMHLGLWWLEVAARGGVETLPIVNQNPVLE